MLEILFVFNPQSGWMFWTFVKRINNIHILVVVKKGWMVVTMV
jgi:hypothetical protein